MLQATRALNKVTFKRFLPPTSPDFQHLVGRARLYLRSSLLQPHIAFVSEKQGREWHEILPGILKLDFKGIHEIRDFGEIMGEIDSKTTGQILDEAFAMLGELHKEIKKEELPEAFSLMGLLKKVPSIPTEEQCRVATPEKFDPAEILNRTFGTVDNIIEMGKKYNLPEKYWAELEDRFTKGYIFLRAAEALSQKV